LSPASMGALYDYVHAMSREPGVVAAQTKSLVTLVPFGTRTQYQQIREYLRYPQVAASVKEYVGNGSTVVSLQPKHGQSTATIDQLIRRIRAQPISAGLRRYVGGFDAGVMDYLDNLYAQFPICILFVVVVTYFVLLVLLRSVILPLKAVLMNALSLLGAYGAVVWIFQQGHLSSIFNFSPTGYVDEVTPIIMFCTLFGLSMDYEVFMLSRVREQYLLTGDNSASVALGLERTGRIITSAAMILVVVAGSFAFTDIVLIKAVGLGLAIAILLDATLIRCLLVPATMRVLGQWNWWLPARLQALLGNNIPESSTDPTRRSVA
jgi:putative drug exporter of the RND superfamily